MSTVSDATAPEAGGGPPVLLATKLHAPVGREQTVPRERLYDRLRSGLGRRLTLVVAPAGFGKTTLLGAWREVEASQRPVAWLTLDDRDDDPVVLWSYVIEALRRACSGIAESASPAMVGSAAIVDVVLPRLVNELADRDDVVLILDDFHRLSSPEARDSVAWFATHAPAGFQLVVATRTEPALRLSALRAHGDLLELRAEDLRFSSEDADALLNHRLGFGLSGEDVDDLVERTEGWPAGLYLASLSLAGVEDRHAYVRSFSAASRHVVDFLVDEVLEVHGPELQTLMLRASILDRFCGPLCDAVMEHMGAAEMLDVLARTNLFLVALDDRGEWYRFHHLFEQLLRVELEHREPGVAPVLHRRAYEWHRDHGTTEEAIHHAVEAGAFAEAAELIAAAWVFYANECRYATVLSWLRRLPDEVRRADVRLVVVEAWVQSMSGRREEAARAIASIEHLGALGDGPLPDGFSSVEGSVTLLGAVFPWGNISDGLERARRAVELEPSGSPWRPVACWAVGFGLYFRGEADEADRWFQEAFELAPASQQWLVAGSALAYRSLIAGERGRLGEQQLFAEEATEIAREHSLEEADGEIPLALAVSLAARGRPRDALPLLEGALVVLRGWGQPIELAKVLLRHAAVLRAVGEREQAAVALAEARAVLDTCADPGVLSERLAALEQSARTVAAPEGGELSERELEVLRFLRGSLSEREIASQIYLSHNTVHSHVRSMYRKLGASSRAEAIEKARDLGLV